MTWPCHGKYVEGKSPGKPTRIHTAPSWARCEVCALQLWYQPRKGSPSSHTAVHNAVMVQRALTQLQPMLHGALPTEEIVKAMLDKITAEEKLNIKVHYIFWRSPTSRAPRRSQSPRQLPRAWRKRWLSPRPTGDQSFRRQLGSDYFGLSRPSPGGRLPDRPGKERSAQFAWCNDELFHRSVKCKVCPRNHPHALIQGIATPRSAYYPVRMVESIVRHWKNQLAPQHHVQALTSADFVEHPNLAECDVKWTQRLQALPAEEVLPPVPDDVDLSDGYDPSILEAPQHSDGVPEEDRQAWHAKLQHYHRAAGHPTNKNLVHLFRDAGLPKWKIEIARDLRCDCL